MEIGIEQFFRDIKAGKSIVVQMEIAFDIRNCRHLGSI